MTFKFKAMTERCCDKPHTVEPWHPLKGPECPSQRAGCHAVSLDAQDANLWDVSSAPTIVMTQRGARRAFQDMLCAAGVEVVQFDFLTPEAVAAYCQERGFLQVPLPCIAAHVCLMAVGSSTFHCSRGRLPPCTTRLPAGASPSPAAGAYSGAQASVGPFRDVCVPGACKTHVSGRVHMHSLVVRIAQVLWECGGTLAAPAIAAGVIHKALAFIAPKLVGPAALTGTSSWSITLQTSLLSAL